MLVARYSDNIEIDIARGFSCWQGLYGLTLNEAKSDAEELLGINSPDIREVPEGGYGVVHHDGLSCYELQAGTVDEAIAEVKAARAYLDGSGFGHATVGQVKVLYTISKEEMGTMRDLHILECDDIEIENC